jgi:hypothetical protein
MKLGEVIVAKVTYEFSEAVDQGVYGAQRRII